MPTGSNEAVPPATCKTNRLSSRADWDLALAPRREIEKTNKKRVCACASEWGRKHGQSPTEACTMPVCQCASMPECQCQCIPGKHGQRFTSPIHIAARLASHASLDHPSLPIPRFVFPPSSRGTPPGSLPSLIACARPVRRERKCSV